MTRYYMFNKPVDCVSARSDENDKTVLDYFNNEDTDELRIVGRLDKNTHGLIFLTDDTKWLTYVTDPKNKVVKRYFFWSMGNANEFDINLIEKGTSLTGMNGKKTAKAKVEIEERATFGDIRHLITGKNCDRLLKNPDSFPVFSGYITVTEGKKHEVRRLVKAAGGCVVYLKRVSMAGIELDDSLEEGQYKLFNPFE